MPDTYVYKARDKAGKTVEGSIEGDSSVLVANRLRQLGYTPLAISKKDQPKGLKTEINIPFLANRVKLEDVSVFSRQFATMINSGLTLIRALNILTIQTESPGLKKIIAEIRQDVEGGIALAAALAKHPKAFDRLYTAMVRAGETAGNLDAVLLNLAESLEKRVTLRREIKSAMTYPVIVMCFILIILTAMLIFIVPQFQTMYKSLGGKLPLPTQILIDVSHIMVHFFVPVAAVIALTIWAIRRWITKTVRGRRTWDSVKLKAPVFGPLVKKIALTRFAENLATLLRSGVPILESLEITKDTIGNVHYADTLSDAQVGVKGGEPIVGRLSKYDLYPPMVYHMVGVGEETGTVDTMLSKIAEFFNQEVEAMVASLTSIMEPVLIMIMGVSVGAMVISLYIPMFKIDTLINSGSGGSGG
jgi:type IV pilus assembly protein PilC